MNLLLGILTFVLVLVSLFLVLVVLMQKAKSDGGMGAAMGGGMAEATFGADTANVLTKATINAAIIFFVLSCALFLGRIYERKHQAASEAGLPSIPVSAAAQSPHASAGAPAGAKPSAPSSGGAKQP